MVILHRQTILHRLTFGKCSGLDGHRRHRCLLLLSSTVVVGEQKMSFETQFFPFWERTKNVLWDTNDFNIDSLMGTKKMSTVFRNSCLSQSGVIVDAKVSDRQRRCCAPCRNVSGYKSSFTCHVLLGSCLLSCWVLFKVRSLSFW